MGDVAIRRLRDSDSISELTSLLHRSYSELAKMGLRYLATHQDDDVTQSRVSSGKCFIAELNGSIVGTITYHPPSQIGHTLWLDREDVAHFGQLAVDPRHQKGGIGLLLIDAAESAAVIDKAFEIALDTAEPARHLIDWYSRLGYRIVESTKWDVTNYTSVIMSKKLVSQ